MDKWQKSISFEVYDDGEFALYLKLRSNEHPGEPNMKVWVRKGDREVASFCNSYRGYGRYANHEELLPGKVRKAAKKAWKDLCRGVYSEEKLAELRIAFYKKHGLSEDDNSSSTKIVSA